MTNANQQLFVELATFEHNRAAWSAGHEGEFVLISGDDIGGFFADYESAFREGLKRYGVRTEFLIKQVCRTDPVFLVY